jgi:hypothetical protein
MKRPKREKKTAATEEARKRTEAMQRAAEHRARAVRYEALAEEAKQRGDFEMSGTFAASAAEERLEAQRIQDAIAPKP